MKVGVKEEVFIGEAVVFMETQKSLPDSNRSGKILLFTFYLFNLLTPTWWAGGFVRGERMPCGKEEDIFSFVQTSK